VRHFEGGKRTDQADQYDGSKPKILACDNAASRNPMREKQRQ